MEDVSGVVSAGYDRVADDYERLEREEWPRLRRLRELLALLPEGASVLDAGCGNGRPALAAIAARHLATGIDVSAEQVARARRHVPGASVVHRDMFTTDFSAQTFDAIVCFYAVEHVPRERHAELFARFGSWLRPGGLLLFTVESRAVDDIVGEWLGQPMFFSQFGPDETMALVRGARFEILRHELETQREGTIEIEYLWVLARRVDPPQ